MSQTATKRPALVSARPSAAPPVKAADALIERVMSNVMNSGFDIDAYHVMDRRDSELINDEILNGAGSSKFVYQFKIGPTEVSGISVVGARHIAAHYKGLKHRIIASIEKRGALFTFTSYPSENMPMSVSCNSIPELEGDTDFYKVLVEVTDVKTGNSLQAEASENRWEQRRDGGFFERPNYQKIAQSKAYRNGILAIIPQDIQIAWKEAQLKLNKTDILTRSVIDEKRSAVVQFAAGRGIPLNREAVQGMTMDQIAGLAEAARTKDQVLFSNAAAALGLIPVHEVDETPHDPETGEIKPDVSRETSAAKGKSAPPTEGAKAKSKADPRDALADILGDVHRAKTREELDGLRGNAAMKSRVSKLSPEDQERVAEAFSVRAADLQGRTVAG